MTGFPHPSVAIAMAEERRAELLAQAQYHALARSAEGVARQPRRAPLPVLAAAAALLLAAGFAAAQETPAPPQAELETTNAPSVTQAVDELVGPHAAQQAAASRL
jgi:hypothetical protein